MKIGKIHLTSGCVGIVIGVCSVLAVQHFSGHRSSASSSSSPFSADKTMYEEVEQDDAGDVYVTPNGKKYHRRECYILNMADEAKQVSATKAETVGYKPCKKCKP